MSETPVSEPTTQTEGTEAQPFVFSLEPKEFHFSIPHVTGERRFVCREASEKAHTRYRNVTMKALTFRGDDKERTGQFSGGAEADTKLVAECIFEKTLKPGPEGKMVPGLSPVSEVEVAGWPRRITSRIYNWIKANSGMDDEEETEEFLVARIESDQAKLARIREHGKPGKGGPSSTSDTSG
jgi:hypothetical protein